MNNISPEFLLIIVNLIILIVTYFWVNPRFSKDNLHKLFINDLLAIVVSLVVSAKIFWGQGITFNLIFIDVNWFFYSIIVYSILEIPFLLKYLKKYKVKI